MPRPNRTVPRCLKCGNADHTTSQCTLEHRVCFHCRKPGHESKACPRRHHDRTCGGCGVKGHTSQGCPDRESWVCKNCAQSGHGHWECTKPKGYSRKRCQLCHSFGHAAPHCENGPQPNPEGTVKNLSNAKGTRGQNPPRTHTLCGEDGRMRWQRLRMPCPTCDQFHESLSCFEDIDEGATPTPSPRGVPVEVLEVPVETPLLEQHEPEAYITRAFAHMKLHEYVPTQREFDLASTEPTHTPRSDDFLRIAGCRLYLGSPSSALLPVGDALSPSGSDENALSLPCRILELEGHMDAYKGAVSRNDWRMARSAYDSCLCVYAQEHSHPSSQVRCWGVELSIAEGKLEDAMKSVDVLLRELRNDVDAMVLRALALFLDVKFSEALEQLAAALKLDPDNEKANGLRSRVKDVVRITSGGYRAFLNNEHQTAIASCTDALGVLGERESECRGGILRSTLLLDRATALCKIRKFAEGLKDVNESLQLRPAHFKAFLCRARIMVGLELFETAAEDFRATLEHGKALLNGSDRRGIEAELEDAERRAKLQQSTVQDHYAILGLTRSCTAFDIKKAYRTLSLKHHPDKGGVAEKFRQIARSYEVLADPDQKRVYDAKLRNPGQGRGPSAHPAQPQHRSYFRKGPDLHTV